MATLTVDQQIRSIALSAATHTYGSTGVGDANERFFRGTVHAYCHYIRDGRMAECTYPGCEFDGTVRMPMPHKAGNNA